MPVGRTGAHAGATPSIGSAAVVLAAGARRFTPSGLFLPTPDRAMAIRDDFSSLHLNCGIVGALMCGGGGAATLAALPTPLGSLLLNALLSTPAFARPPARFPIAAEPPPRAPPPPRRAQIDTIKFCLGRSTFGAWHRVER
jgi:hypothetical protein